MKTIASILLMLAIAPRQAPPNTRVQDCTTSGCHSSQVAAKFLHAPTAAGACEMCHVSVDETKHTFQLKHQGAELCNFCHLGKSDVPGMHMHQPVKDGECVKCHSPHGSEHRFLIRGETTGALCLTCHESVIKDRAHVHTPIAQGDCLGCHKAHASALPGLLVEQGRTLCLRCHANVATGVMPAHAPAASVGGSVPAVLGAHDGIEVAASNPAIVEDDRPLFVHEPFKGECTQCHDQHASNQTSLLKQVAKDLCISCHQDVAQKLAAATVPHSAVSVDRACMNCHSPHTAHDPGLLRNGAVTLCLECHNKPIARSDGSTIESVASMAAAGQHLHGAIGTGQCSDCHDVHGGDHRALLTRPYAQGFYQPFSADAYALCFGCHDPKLATEPKSSAVTAFRNGEVNLHYVHVTAPGEAGRSCRVCHDTHSAANQRQVRDSVPYGNWQVPIAFDQNGTGGSCGAGCHRARSYDRITPVVYESAARPGP